MQSVNQRFPNAFKNLLAALYAGIAASIVSTLVQLLLWWLFWDVLPSIFYRDVQFTAAIVLGKEVLQPLVEAFDWQLMWIATCIHVALSIIYAIILSYLIHSLDLKKSLIAGGLFGLGIFAINMYGFVIIFPWFVETRDWITITAHVAFGVSAAGVYQSLSKL